MKKVAGFLALVIVFCSFVGCSDSQNEVKADEGIWSVQKTTDEFGDVTEDSQNVICASVEGVYENETTTESTLGVSVNLKKRADFNHYIIEFQLTENNTSKIQYEEGSYKQLKTKVGEEIQEFYLSLDDGSGKLSHGNEAFYEINYGGDYIFSNLYNGKDVKCVIEIEDSAAYSFELKSDNFKALCEANNFTKGAGKITVRESVNFLLQDKGIMIEESCDFLISRYETFELMQTEDLKELLNGRFLQIFLTDREEFPDSFLPWRLDEYSAENNTMKPLCLYSFNGDKESGPQYREDYHGYDFHRDHVSYSDVYKIQVEDNLVKREIDGIKFEVRKISDDFYIIRSETMFSTISYNLIIRLPQDYDGNTDVSSIAEYSQMLCFNQIPN